MTSFCDYLPSEPAELFKSGRRFAHHPEFYALASNFYGPGYVYCWYLLIFSVFLKWSVHAKPRIRLELYGIALYPALAATDMLIQSLITLRIQHRSEGVLCFLFSPYWGDLEGTQLQRFDDNPLGEDVLHFGQKIIRLAAPHAICYPFAYLCFLVWISNTDNLTDERGTARVWLRRASRYVSFALAVYHLTLAIDHFGYSLAASFFPGETARFMMNSVFRVGSLIPGFPAFIVSINCFGLKKPLALVISIILVAVAVGGLVAVDAYATYPLYPDLGISLSGKDQLSALLAGTLNLESTAYSLLLRSHRSTLYPSLEPIEVANLDRVVATSGSPDKTSKSTRIQASRTGADVDIGFHKSEKPNQRIMEGSASAKKRSDWLEKEPRQ
ncbi:hypothetical protein QBC42DRAFT_318959 [Cladorrhinum samala]|uniref:Uncharacterized protein n=1 Tax=Cladorrhinum samala TaxID=585594 RepID=A0AAV9I5L1_9PEZI|nr:hypothetical protein QBC42DRAFT_318959 [Cladorrhinum samala]